MRHGLEPIEYHLGCQLGIGETFVSMAEVAQPDTAQLSTLAKSCGRLGAVLGSRHARACADERVGQLLDYLGIDALPPMFTVPDGGRCQLALSGERLIAADRHGRKLLAAVRRDQFFAEVFEHGHSVRSVIFHIDRGGQWIFTNRVTNAHHIDHFLGELDATPARQALPLSA
ncbi:MAG: hypothetical protein HKN26_05000 [Acidimicrobiales bacterium]|nr:hypothetical protein [Acidimicrobiales bacterium]